MFYRRPRYVVYICNRTKDSNLRLHVYFPRRQTFTHSYIMRVRDVSLYVARNAETSFSALTSISTSILARGRKTPHAVLFLFFYVFRSNVRTWRVRRTFMIFFFLYYIFKQDEISTTGRFSKRPDLPRWCLRKRICEIEKKKRIKKEKKKKKNNKTVGCGEERETGQRRNEWRIFYRRSFSVPPAADGRKSVGRTVFRKRPTTFPYAFCVRTLDWRSRADPSVHTSRIIRVARNVPTYDIIKTSFGLAIRADTPFYASD